MSYGLVTGTGKDFHKLAGKFEKRVKRLLFQGWVLYGQMTHEIDKNGVHYISQTIVKHWHRSQTT